MLRPSKEDGARIRKVAADAGKSVQRYCLDILLDVCPASAEDVQEEQGAKDMATIIGVLLFGFWFFQALFKHSK